MTIKIICAFLISLMSLAGCGQNKVSRCPTAKLSSGAEDNLILSRSNTPSDPLQVCSPAADLHAPEPAPESEPRTWLWEGLESHDVDETYSDEVTRLTAAATRAEEEQRLARERAEAEEEEKEARERRAYELTKSEFNSISRDTLVPMLFRNKLTPLQSRVITDILVNRMGCRPEEILYTYYKASKSDTLVLKLKVLPMSAEEKETIRRILEHRGVTIPES